jgi:hypothetical protein
MGTSLLHLAAGGMAWSPVSTGIGALPYVATPRAPEPQAQGCRRTPPGDVKGADVESATCPAPWTVNVQPRHSGSDGAPHSFPDRRGPFRVPPSTTRRAALRAASSAARAASSAARWLIKSAMLGLLRYGWSSGMAWQVLDAS